MLMVTLTVVFVWVTTSVAIFGAHHREAEAGKTQTASADGRMPAFLSKHAPMERLDPDRVPPPAGPAAPNRHGRVLRG